MTTNEEIASGASVVGNVETVIATLATWHPIVDVYAWPNGVDNCDGTLWRVYAIDGALEALIAEGTYTFDGDHTQSQRVLSVIQGAGVTMQLRVVTNGLPTSGPMTGIIVGYDTSTDVTPPTESNGSTHTLGTTNFAFGTLPQWHPAVDAIVDASAGGPSVIGNAIFGLYASFPSVAGFPDCIVQSVRLSSVRQNIIQGFEGGAETWVLKGRTTGPVTGNVTANVIGHTGSATGGGNGGGAIPEVKLIAGQNMVPGTVIRTNNTNQAIIQPAAYDKPHYAVCLQTVVGGVEAKFQVAGPLDPAVFNLGAGIACAVGMNAAGLAVRSTDPACVSPKNWIGFCDTAGNLDIQPVQREKLWALDYGAIPENTSLGARNQNVASVRAMMATITAFDADKSLWEAKSYYFGTDPRVFSAVVHVGGGTGAITPNGTPTNEDWAFVVKVTNVGGTLFQYSLDGGVTFNGADIAIPALPGVYVVPGTGVTLNFGAGTYVQNETQSFSAWRPVAIQLTRPMSFEGQGGTSSFGTTFYFPDGLTGIRTWLLGMVPPGPDTNSDSEGAVILDIALRAEGSSDLTAHAIDVRAITIGLQCISLLWGGNGINIESKDGGRPDICYFNRWNSYFNQNGIFIKGGDTNVCNFVSCEFNLNRGYGRVDNSFLGCNFDSCQEADNMLGPFYVNTVGSSATKGMYSEGDQPPGVVVLGAVWNIGGQQSAGYAVGSAQIGGVSGSDLYPVIYTTRAGQPMTLAGTNPPPMVMGGNLSATPANIRIECTTPGYPGGYDSFHTFHAGQVAVFRASVDGGATWVNGITPTRADQNAVFGISTYALPGTGLTAYFVPYFYSANNVYTSANFTAGAQAFFGLASSDGSNGVWRFGHTTPSDPGNDPAEHKLVYQAGNGRWEPVWANSRSFLGLQMAGGRALPYPGLQTSVNGYRSNDDSWVANERHNVILWADGGQVLGSGGWITSLLSPTHWFSPGDVALNRSQTSFWPLGWRASTNGGWSGPGATGVGWSSAKAMFPGYSIEVGGFVYRSNSDGNLSVGGAPPANYGTHQTIGSNFMDGNCTMVCMGAVGNPFEPIGTASETQNSLNVAAGGTFALTSNNVNPLLRSDYQRFLMSGAVAADFNVTIDKGPAGSWVRFFDNTTTKNCTVTATEGGGGVLIPAGACVGLYHDGTQIVPVNSDPGVDVYTLKTSTANNAANTVLLTLPALKDNQAALIKVEYRGKQTGNFNEAVTIDGTKQAYFRNNGGAATAMGTAAAGTVDGTAGLGTSVASIALTGNQPQIRITSGVNAGVDWQLTVYVLRMT